MRLIDANALAKHIKDLPTWWADDGGVYPGGSMKYPDGMYYPEDIISSIDNAPTVDAVEVVHGKWLYDSGTERHFCSACNEYAISVITNTPVYEYDWEENLQLSHIEADCDEQLTNFCPNCAAKMDGVNEDVSL